MTGTLCPTCEGDWTAEKARQLDESPAACPNCGGNIYEPFLTARYWQWPRGDTSVTCSRCKGNGWVYDPSDGGTMVCPAECTDGRIYP